MPAIEELGDDSSPKESTKLIPNVSGNKESITYSSINTNAQEMNNGSVEETLEKMSSVAILPLIIQTLISLAGDLDRLNIFGFETSDGENRKLTSDLYYITQKVRELLCNSANNLMLTAEDFEKIPEVFFNVVGELVYNDEIFTQSHKEIRVNEIMGRVLMRAHELKNGFTDILTTIRQLKEKSERLFNKLTNETKTPSTIENKKKEIESLKKEKQKLSLKIEMLLENRNLFQKYIIKKIYLINQDGTDESITNTNLNEAKEAIDKISEEIEMLIETNDGNEKELKEKCKNVRQKYFKLKYIIPFISFFNSIFTNNKDNYEDELSKYFTNKIEILDQKRDNIIREITKELFLKTETINYIKTFFQKEEILKIYLINQDRADESITSTNLIKAKEAIDEISEEIKMLIEINPGNEKELKEKCKIVLQGFFKINQKPSREEIYYQESIDIILQRTEKEDKTKKLKQFIELMEKCIQNLETICRTLDNVHNKTKNLQEMLQNPKQPFSTVQDKIDGAVASFSKCLHITTGFKLFEEIHKQFAIINMNETFVNFNNHHNDNYDNYGREMMCLKEKVKKFGTEFVKRKESSYTEQENKFKMRIQKAVNDL